METLLFDRCPLPACVAKADDGRFLAINDAFAKLFKLDRDNISKISVRDLNLWIDNRVASDFVNETSVSGQATKFVVEVGGDEKRDLYEISSEIVAVSSERAVVSYLTNITDKKALDLNCDQISKRFNELTDVINDSYFRCDASGKFTKVNLAFCALLGYSEYELISTSIDGILSSGQYKRDIETLYAREGDRGYAEPIAQEWIKRDKTAAQMEVCLFVSKNDRGEPNGFWGVARETNERVNIAEEEALRYNMYHDPLTELPNRSWLIDRLYRMTKRSRIADEQIALLFVDVSKFRLINDAHGYLFGDSALKEIARLMESTLRSTDLLVRFGGDEFAIAVCAQPINRSAFSVIRRLLRLFDKPIAIKDKQITLSAHIGVSVFPNDSADADSLIANAKEALAKISTKNESAFHFISAEFDKQFHERIELEKAFGNALASNEIIACYQPINEFSADGKPRLIGLEAYVRWLSPTFGELAPDNFMDMAEELGLATDIDRKIYEIALSNLSEWIKEGLSIKVTVNLSKNSLEDSSFAKWAITLAQKKNIDPKLICFDARYGYFVNAERVIYKTVSQLSEAGFYFCADDFGEGILLLARLKQIGINAVKIAPKRLLLIKEYENDEFNSLRSIELAARTMGFEFAVAGVESEWLDRKVGAAGANIRQGFLYSKPLNPKEVKQYAQGLK
jgi:diguanylate cyclase (GGDEF)-like protein/PAS domain S-box-containing protein